MKRSIPSLLGTLGLLAPWACTEAPKEASHPKAVSKAAASKASSRTKEEHTGEKLSIGATIPQAEHAMASATGDEPRSIADVKGAKGTLVIFTCNHCPWVKAWQERTVALANRVREQGVGVVAINSNDPSKNAVDGVDGMKHRAEALGMKYPYVVDDTSQMARAFGADKTPEFFLFDAEDKLVYRGALDDNAKNPDQVTETYLNDAVTALVAGEAIQKSVTKALGCGIKFRPQS